MTRPIAVDLFSGAGGMSLGFEQAGFDIVAAIEIDPIHAAVHAFNFPKCAVMCRDISKVSGTSIREAAGIGKRKVDLVMGGAPCQGFSLIGHRALDDPRNKLVGEFVRIVCELDARYFVFENVKGLTVGRQRLFLEELVGSFEARGYNVRKPWEVLNAAEYGVPQDRERLILLGAKKGLRLPEYPAAQNRAAGTGRTADRLPEGPSCKAALGDLPNVDRYETLFGTDEVRLARGAWGKPGKYAREMRGQSNNAWHHAQPRIWDASVLTSSMRAVHTDISRRRFAETKQGKVEPISRFFKLPADGVANTLRAGTDSARGAFTSPRPIHYRYPRCVTVREMARLHGFPDWFRFHETKWHGARQIGNAVAPPLARAIGAAIMRALGQTPNRLLDIFLGLTTYSLQSHLRTTLANGSQIEIDELYVGLDKQGCHYAIPVQAKGGSDQISVVQTAQDIQWCAEQFENVRCKAISAQFLSDESVALFELTVKNDEVKVVEERHYKLLPADKLDAAAIRNYKP